MMRKFILFLIAAGISRIWAGPFEIDTKHARVKIDGAHYPIVGFGTYPLNDAVCRESVTHAAQIGCRIIDTATFYENFSAIANALKGYDRRDFYIISKVWPNTICRK